MKYKIGYSAVRHGTNGNDTLSGFDFDELYFGYGGNDTFMANGGADTYYGGSGFDTIDYSRSDEGVTVSLEDGYGKGGDAEGDKYYSIERAIGSKHADSLSGDGGANRLWGQDGNDFLFGRDGQDTLYGGSNNDRLYGGNQDDDLFGGDGSDYLRGGNHDDSLLGDAGNDRLYGDQGEDWLSGGSNNDRLYGGSQDDYLSGGSGADRLYGGQNDDLLHGGTGPDHLDGGSGFDFALYQYDQVTIDLEAGTGSGGDAEGDTLTNIEGVEIWGAGADVFGDNGDNQFRFFGENGEFYGRGGDDHFTGVINGNRLDGGEGTDTVEIQHSSGVEVDLDAGTALYRFIPGWTQNDLVDIENVIGSTGDDVIFGDENNNVLRGQNGNDYLNGRGGDDRLNGGQGADTFAFDIGGFEAINDVVEDFEVGVDTLDFSQVNRIDDFDEFLEESQQVGADVVVDTGLGSITLENTTLAALTEGDFLF